MSDHDHCLSCPFRGCEECRYQSPNKTSIDATEETQR